MAIRTQDRDLSENKDHLSVKDIGSFVSENNLGYFDGAGIYRIDKSRAISQNIRPLRFGIINIMGQTDRSETYQSIRQLLSGTPIQLDVIDLSLETNIGKGNKNLRDQYLKEGASEFEIEANKGLDALIITGAGFVGQEFSDNNYWNEFKNILAWANQNVAAQLLYCWSAHAGLNANHGIDRIPNINNEGKQFKLFGNFEHTKTSKKNSPFPLLHYHSNDSAIFMPHSRGNGVNEAQVEDNNFLETLIRGNDKRVGSAVIGENFREEQFSSILYSQGHPEYPTGRLSYEYFRDLGQFYNPDHQRNLAPDKPENNNVYNPSNDWRAHGRVIYDALINQALQRTHFELPENTYTF